MGGGSHQLLHGAGYSGLRQYGNSCIEREPGAPVPSHRRLLLWQASQASRESRLREENGEEESKMGDYLCQSLSLGVLHEGDLNWTLLLAFAAAPAARGLDGRGGGGTLGCSRTHGGERGGEGMLVQVIAQVKRYLRQSRRLDAPSDAVMIPVGILTMATGGQPRTREAIPILIIGRSSPSLGTSPHFTKHSFKPKSRASKTVAVGCPFSS